MRKFAFILILLFSLAIVSVSDVQKQKYFLPEDIDIAKSDSAVNGTDFESWEAPLQSSWLPVVGIVVIFTRDTGDADTLDVNFEVSYDNGTTWASYEDGKIQVPTNYSADGDGTVRYYQPLPVYGISHIRVSSIVNNWSGDEVADVNVSFSASRR